MDIIGAQLASCRTLATTPTAYVQENFKNYERSQSRKVIT